MKTMNVLLVMILLIFSTACTNYNPLAGSGTNHESEPYYMELNFHQAALAYEDELLRVLMLEIQEEMEKGNIERQNIFEESRERRAIIEQNVTFNDELLSRGPIRPSGPPPRCIPDSEVFEPCPLPKLALENFYLSTEQFPDKGGRVDVLDIKGQLVGEIVARSEVPESEGTFVKAEMEYDGRSAHEVRITKLDARGELETTLYRLE